MICIHCGKQISDDADACPFCGIQIQSETMPTASPFPSGNDPTDLTRIKGWSYPAFFSSWIWCFGNRLWFLGVLMLVVKLLPAMSWFITKGNLPCLIIVLIIKLIFWIYVSMNGKEFAWIARPFENTEQFITIQTKWNYWTSGLIVFYYSLLVFFIIIVIPYIFVGRDRGRVQFSQCLETLHGLKVAEEMYLTDNNIYTANMKELAMYMIPGCSDPKGIASPCDNLAIRLDGKGTGNCRNGTVSITLNKDKLSYQIKGAALDRSNRNKGCGICVTPNGYTPSKFASCDGHPHPATDCP